MFFGIPEVWNPFEKYGFKGSFFEVNLELLLNSIYASAILIILAMFARKYLKKKATVNLK
jgi:hypothetical protein